MKKLVPFLFLFLLLGSSFSFRSAKLERMQMPVFFMSNGHLPLASQALPLTLEVKIEQPQSPTSTDGILSLHVSGGKAPYTIQVISTFSPSQVYKKEKIELKKLGIGNYVIVVQDAEKHVLQKIIELTPVQ